MNPLPPGLRRLLAMISALSHPSPSILAPGIVALLLWMALPVLVSHLPEGWVFTTAFAASYLTHIGRRLLREAHRGRIDLTHRDRHVPILSLGLVVLFILFSQHSIAFSQHFLSIHFATLTGLLILDYRDANSTDAARFWGSDTSVASRRAFAAGWALLSLSALALNEVLILTLTPQDWLVAWAISPVILHYAAVMTLQVAVLSTGSDDLDA